ncbi:MAG: FtsX-like permease family protein [Phycisphaerae bacterium]|nr:FtsX-like permease family protein [Phycisphaerae bacterium]MDD5381485.1 FtsX-like permease family protein [Phycisphaerae bacterium]
MYKIILSFRYLLKKRISYLAFLAVALCVFIVVVVMTVMTGLVRDFKDSNHKWVGDCVVGTESLVGFPYYEDFMKKIEGADFIEGVSAVIKSYALIKNRDLEWNSGVEILGIDPFEHSKVTNFGETLYHRKNDAAKAFEPIYAPNLPGCVVGIDFWLRRDDRGKYDYEVRPVEAALLVSCFPLTAKGALAKAGTDMVNTKTFYYSDTVHSGLVRVDSSFVYLPFEEAQLLCGMGGAVKRASAIHIKFKPNIKLADGCGKVAALWKVFAEERKGAQQAELLNTVAVQSWKDYRREFIAAMEKEQTILTFMFALVGVTTVFIVFVVFYMIVSHKSKDIGILKSIGVSRLDIVELFSCFAFLIGLLGSAIGVFGGWLFLLKINRIEDFLFAHFGFQLWNRAMYAIGDIPNTVDSKVLAVIIVSAIGACLAGAFFPSRQAAKLEPVETLQVSQL